VPGASVAFRPGPWTPTLPAIAVTPEPG
jgi:hypothetical protein